MPSNQIRVEVNSANRLDGATYDFRFEIDAPSFRHFRGKQVGCAVEYCHPIRFSPTETDYSVKVATNGKGVFLDLMTFPQSNSWQTWSDHSIATPAHGETNHTLCFLQTWVESGYHGRHQAPCYVRKDTMAALFTGDQITSTNILRFKLYYFDGTDVTAIDGGDNIEDFTFSLLFWEYDETAGKAPTYPFYRAWLSTADKLSGTAQDCVVPFNLKTNTAWSSTRRDKQKWMVAVDWHSTVKYDNATLVPGLKLLIDSLRSPENYSTSFYPLMRSFWSEEDKYYGIRLSQHPLARDHLGWRLDEGPDLITQLRLQILDASTGAAPGMPSDVEDYIVSLVFWQVPE